LIPSAKRFKFYKVHLEVVKDNKALRFAFMEVDKHCRWHFEDAADPNKLVMGCVEDVIGRSSLSCEILEEIHIILEEIMYPPL
jgi:hypothetical protein